MLYTIFLRNSAVPGWIFCGSARSIGKAMTSLRSVAPRATITSRSKPRATPVEAGRPWSMASNRRLTSGSVYCRPRRGPGWRRASFRAARRRRSIRGTRWPTRCRRRTTQTAPPRELCLAVSRPMPPGWLGSRTKSSVGCRPSVGSTQVTQQPVQPGITIFLMPRERRSAVRGCRCRPAQRQYTAVDLPRWLGERRRCN